MKQPLFIVLLLVLTAATNINTTVHAAPLNYFCNASSTNPKTVTIDGVVHSDRIDVYLTGGCFVTAVNSRMTRLRLIPDSDKDMYAGGCFVKNCTFDMSALTEADTNGGRGWEAAVSYDKKIQAFTGNTNVYVGHNVIVGAPCALTVFFATGFHAALKPDSLVVEHNIITLRGDNDPSNIPTTDPSKAQRLIFARLYANWDGATNTTIAHNTLTGKCVAEKWELVFLDRDNEMKNGHRRPLIWVTRNVVDVTAGDGAEVFWGIRGGVGGNAAMRMISDFNTIVRNYLFRHFEAATP